MTITTQAVMPMVSAVQIDGAQPFVVSTLAVAGGDGGGESGVPTAHAASHAAGGSDPITPASIGALAATGGTIADYREALGNVTTTGNITLTLAHPVQRIVLDAVRQITAPADPGAVAASLTIILLCQSYTPTWAGITWLTSDGNAPVLNTASGKRNVITLIWDDAAGGTGAWLGFFGGSES